MLLEVGVRGGLLRGGGGEVGLASMPWPLVVRVSGIACC